MVTKFTNVRLLRGHEIVQDDLWMRNGKIIDPVKRFWEAVSEKEFYADVVRGAAVGWRCARARALTQVGAGD